MHRLINFLLQNANEFRYMYFGIIITVVVFFTYFLIKDLKREKNKKFKINNFIKNKNFIAIILAIIPIILEMVLYNNIRVVFERGTYIRIAYYYFIVFSYILYKMIVKKSGKLQQILDFIVKHRYKIAIIIFAILVIGKINFSSLGMWDIYIREDVNSTVFGKNRSIRSDEWLVSTPFNLSQEYNNFKLVNPNLDAGNNDMNVFHAPVFDLTLIVRIYNWGFILFGNEIGLAWQWSLKLILAFLISFELGMMLTKKDKLLSIMIAFWITLSPAIMWWSICDTILLAMAIVVIFYNYVSNPQWKIGKKLLLAYLMVVFLCNFAFCLYPAWQVPLTYIILVFTILNFIRYRKNIKGKDYAIMIATIIIALSIVIYFFITSWNGINSIMSTKYPGARLETGGDYNFNKLVDYYSSFFTPYQTNQYENPCDMSNFIYPLLAIIIILICYCIKTIKAKEFLNKLRDKENWNLLGIILLATVFFTWLKFKWPIVLSRITLFYMSPTDRMAIIFGFCGVLITIMLAVKIFNRDKKLFNNWVAFGISIAIVIIAMYAALNTTYADKFNTFKLFVLATAIFSMNYTLLSSNKKAFIYVMVIISIIVGGYVNPINIGTKAITETRIAKAATQIAKEDPNAIWIGQGQLNSQYLVANGIKVLNGINEYPNYSWIDKIDAEHKYEEVWNRYAHIIITLDYETYFELKLTDAYEVHMTYKNLKDIGIKYYYTNEKLNDKMLHDFSMKMVYEDNEAIHYIYEIQ